MLAVTARPVPVRAFPSYPCQQPRLRPVPQLAPSRPCPLPCLPRRPLRVTACTAMPPQRHTREASTHSAQRQQQAAGNILPFRRPSGADAGAGAAAGAGRAPAAQPLPEWRLHLAHSPSADVERLSLQPEGWNTWNWRGHRVNWVGAGSSGPAVVLIHGYGGSCYHWRSNIPHLARHCRVFALDCLGFGWSDKPLIDYHGVWPQQIADFMREVVGEPAVLVGNSLGGYNALHTAALQPDIARGVVLLNAAGGFERPRRCSQRKAATLSGASMDDSVLGPLPSPALDVASVAIASSPGPAPLPSEAVTAAAQRAGWVPLGARLASALEWARGGALRALVRMYYRHQRQERSIRRSLEQLYVHKHRVDDDLVRSVAIPAADPLAEQVVFHLLAAAMRAAPLNALLDHMELHDIPLLMLWGDKDPWTLKNIPSRIRAHYPAARLERLPAGHCPHDDAPHLVNSHLLNWIYELED